MNFCDRQVTFFLINDKNLQACLTKSAALCIIKTSREPCNNMTRFLKGIGAHEDNNKKNNSGIFSRMRSYVMLCRLRRQG